MELTNPYPLGPEQVAAREVCGSIGFVEYRRRLDESPRAGGLSTIGVYDLDLSRLGLEWREENSLPTAFASEVPGAAPRGAAADSITILLNAGSEERIVLLGRQDASGIVGDWSARSARGVATGVFSMHPRGSSDQSCRSD